VKRLLLIAAAVIALTGCQPWLHIHELGIHEPIVPGGQATIDRGNVTQVYPNLLAGHRTSHGAVFANVPAMSVGTEFWTTGFQGRDLTHWRVVKRQIVTSKSSAVLAGWPLVIQTSMPNGDLLLFCQRI